ncbi:MAG TPA: tetratricopeptide repeat protein [Gemmatimonadales bacterium]|jgi:tetratricopeptide (TPR) repeat protein
MNRIHRLLALAVTVSATPAVLSAQNPPPGITLQYTSPAGVKYYSQADTGPVARAKRGVNSTPTNWDSLITLGLAQSGVRQYREAILTFTKALAVEPRNAIGLRWRGHRYLSIHQVDSAYNDLTRGSQMDTTIYGIWFHLGIARYVRGDFAGAADAFQHARPKAPTTPDDVEYIGSSDWWWMSARRAGKADLAQAALTSMRPDSTINVGHGTAYMQRIRLYRGSIKPEQMFTPADTEDVQVATLAYGLGNWYLVKGDTVHAREQFTRAVASGAFPAFGFIAAEAELKRLGAAK